MLDFKNLSRLYMKCRDKENYASNLGAIRKLEAIEYWSLGGNVLISKLISLTYPLCFLFQDLAKKDTALLKLGSELKELEKVQDELEKKEQELRAERNTVTIQDFF